MNTIESLVYTSAFSLAEEEKKTVRKEIRIRAKQKGIFSASIHNEYMRYAKGELKGFTVPAFNIRNLTYDFSRLIFHLMKEKRVGYLIFEIARGEVGYTAQSHDEYVTSVFAAAIAEDWKGPIYFQADHTQISKEKYTVDPKTQEELLKKFIASAIDAGVYNIDIDASTLVDLSKSNVEDQQKENAHMTAVLTNYIREIEPKGITISIGGEIGHIGGKNSTVEEYKAFMKLFQSQLQTSIGLSKISVQTGTSHGGVVNADGSLKHADVDFFVIESIGKIAKESFHMGGVVQHGASTLPATLFHRFPEVGTLEIHLATEFQNIIFDHMSPELKKEIYAWLDINCSKERKEGQTNEQFYYQTRKRANSQFKEKIWKMESSYKQNILSALEKEVRLILHELKMENTA